MREPIEPRKAKKLVNMVKNTAIYLTQKEYDEIVNIISKAMDETCKELGVFKSAT